jgi:outer membrane protein assembly factor BamE (lipoprotein component of BamABCDE complex)
LLLGAIACSPKVDNRGYVSDADWKDQITVGTSTMDDVLVKFGSPSSRSSFGSESWYYISQRKETTAFFAPEIADQEVMHIAFDSNGVVSNVEKFTKAQAQEFALVKRTTPTEGHSMSFVEQVLGNIGRFNKAGGETLAPGRQSKR